ncbi:MAG TPA: GMC family oxidoreductase N-terminal domain-containing protein, partial [Kribbella sp.]
VNPSVRVLLLEAGGEDSAPETRIPALHPLHFGTGVDWGYSTVPQAHTGTRVSMPRGKMLGGSSSMNAMVYIRGNRADYDGWRDEFGATEWGFEDVLPYFIRAEGNSRLSGPLHGSDGPLHVEDAAYLHEMNHAWVDSAIAWGLPRSDDFNGASQLGAGTFQTTCHDGQRWSTADAYLRPSLHRLNLTVRTRAQVSSVLLEGARAVGVTYSNGTESVSVGATSEVLLCGGSINSPQLLLLSGIGPADHLRENGIDTVVDLPSVGQNLHDHPTVPIIWTTRDSTDIFDLAMAPEAMAQWQETHRGPLTSVLCDVGGFFSTTGDTAIPNMQVHTAPTAFADGLPRPAKPCFTGTVSLLDPRSRGSLQLRSADPHGQPEIDLGLYADSADLDALVSGLRTFIEMSTAGPLARHLDQPLLPDQGDTDDHALAAFTRRWTQTMYHPVGTCAMGTHEQAVVDPSLRVRGVERLRVVDASVMPTVPRGNLNAPTVMIAEKASDLILS